MNHTIRLTLLTVLIAFFTNSYSQQNELVKQSQVLLSLQKDNRSPQKIVDFLATTTLDQLTEGLKTNDEKLAFWVNVYNGFIQYTLSEKPELYDDRRKFFSEKRIKIAGEILSFADIEHGIIRKSQSPIGAGYIRRIFRSKWERKLRVNKKDWRIHFALNCGAKSCPPVAIYNAQDLNKQFDFMTKTYLKEQTTVDGTTANVVSLFSWFRGDFGGKRGAKRILKEIGITDSKPKKLNFTTYDWTLLLDNYREIKL